MASGGGGCALLPPGFPAVPPYFIHTFDVDAMPTSRSKTQHFRCVNAGLIKHTPPRMEDFVVACPLVPGVPPLLSGPCAAPRLCGLRLPSDPTARRRPGLRLAFDSANIWHGDFHPASSVPCPAHTPAVSGGQNAPAFWPSAPLYVRRGLGHQDLDGWLIRVYPRFRATPFRT
jgi:hypothetical protein